MNSIVPYDFVDKFNEHFHAGVEPRWVQHDRDTTHEVMVMTRDGLVPAKIRGGYFTDTEVEV